MADNIDVTPGSGKTIGADDVGGALHQRVKPTWGPDGVGNDIDVASGKPLPVQVRSETGLIPLGEPTDAKASATDTTSVSAISLLKQLSAYLAGTLVVNASGNAVPVTDNGGNLSVDDGGGSLTVDGAVTVTNAGTFAVQATEADGANVTLGAKADAKSAATDTTAITIMSVLKQISASIQAAAASLAGTLTVAAHAVTNAGTFAVQESGSHVATDDAAFSPATGKVLMAGFEFDDTSPDSVDEGDAGAGRMSSRREQYMQIRDAAGNERGANVNASNQLQVAGPVTNAGTFVVQENGAALTALQLIDDPVIADDAAFTPATSKVMMAGFEFDDTGPDSVDEGDAGAARMSANRNVYTQIRDAAGNERGANVNASNQLAVAGPVTNAGTFAVQAAEADGANVTLGAKADAKSGASDTTAVTIMSVLKQISFSIQAAAASVAGSLTVSGSVTANAGTNLNTSTLALEAGGNLATAVASLSVIDDWDETDRAKVNPIVGQAGVAAGAGAVAATVQRVTLASDDPAVASLSVLDDWDETDRAKVNVIVGQAGIAAGTGVDGVTVPRVTLATNVALPAGTNAIGKLSANSGVDIGDVDVTSVPADPFGANADAASASGSISAKLRGIATALGITAFDLGSGTGGSRTLRFFFDTAQWIGGAGTVTSAVQRATLASDDPAVTSLQLIDDAIFTDDAAYTPATSKLLVVGAQADETSPDSVDEGDAGALRMTLARELLVAPRQPFVTCSTDITRPADTTAYAANDAMSDSTSAPTSGGFTFTGAARKSGGSGIIVDAKFATSADPATTLQGEIWLFNAAVTNVNDNAALAVSDAEIKTCVGKIPFVMEDAGNNGFFHATNLNIGFTCSGSANLRYLIKVKNAYTPVSGEVLTVTLTILQMD